MSFFKSLWFGRGIRNELSLIKTVCREWGVYRDGGEVNISSGGEGLLCQVCSLQYQYHTVHHSKCACGGQSLALPHHLVCSKGGHCLPAPLGCLITSLRLCISPMPHDTLHALHSDQSPTRQSRYPVTCKKETDHLENQFHHRIIYGSLWLPGRETR